MKKSCVLFIIIISIFHSFIAKAQWTTIGSNIYYNLGNVGIGTTTPTQPLSVFGTIQSTNSGTFASINGISYSNTAYQGSRIGLTRYRGVLGTPLAVQTGDLLGWMDCYGYDGTTANRAGECGFIVDATPTAGVTPARFYISTAGSDGVTHERMRITSQGYVGINTINTFGYQFAVNGSAIATSMTVKLYGNWPDYVFRKDYQLPTLDAVKNYIDLNHHLPEIPSEQQIAKHGLNLGDMDKLLVQKTEELTLYLIEKDKQLKEEQSKVAEQEDKLAAQQEQINLMKQQIAAIEKQLIKK